MVVLKKFHFVEKKINFKTKSTDDKKNAISIMIIKADRHAWYSSHIPFCVVMALPRVSIVQLSRCIKIRAEFITVWSLLVYLKGYAL